MQPNILRKPQLYTSSEAHSDTGSNENGIRLLRYHSTSFPSSLNFADLTFNSSASSAINRELDQSTLKEVDVNFKEPIKLPSDLTTAPVLCFILSIFFPFFKKFVIYCVTLWKFKSSDWDLLTDNYRIVSAFN